MDVKLGGQEGDLVLGDFSDKVNDPEEETETIKVENTGNQRYDILGF